MQGVPSQTVTVPSVLPGQLAAQIPRFPLMQPAVNMLIQVPVGHDSHLPGPQPLAQNSAIILSHNPEQVHANVPTVGGPQSASNPFHQGPNGPQASASHSGAPSGLSTHPLSSSTHPLSSIQLKLPPAMHTPLPTVNLIGGAPENPAQAPVQNTTPFLHPLSWPQPG